MFQIKPLKMANALCQNTPNLQSVECKEIEYVDGHLEMLTELALDWLRGRKSILKISAIEKAIDCKPSSLSTAINRGQTSFKEGATLIAYLDKTFTIAWRHLVFVFDDSAPQLMPIQKSNPDEEE